MTVNAAEQALAHVQASDLPLSVLFTRLARTWQKELGAWTDLAFLQGAIRSRMRWAGWIEPLGLERLEDQLRIATLMDLDRVPEVCRHWARQTGHDPGQLVACGDAPTWTAKTEGFKRLVGRRDVAVDPWRLFPAAFRQMAAMPPGDDPPKVRQIRLIESLQRVPQVWLRAQGESAAAIWNELKELGLKPWVHRRLINTARVDPGVQVSKLDVVRRGALEIQDLGSQLVAHIANPEPGQRWWVPMAERGSEVLHLAALMNGKGVVVATSRAPEGVKAIERLVRYGPFRNVSAKAWDGRHVVGKTASYDGVVVLPPCTGFGTWRRLPEARWQPAARSLTPTTTSLMDTLRAAAAGVRVGGTLIYAVPTFTLLETTDLIRAFLAEHTAFHLDPFPTPLTHTKTDGKWTLWPFEADSDGWFYSRMHRLS